jgi:hypothetical protein
MAPGLYFRMATGCGSISTLEPSVLTMPAQEIETLLETDPRYAPVLGREVCESSL